MKLIISWALGKDHWLLKEMVNFLAWSIILTTSAYTMNSPDSSVVIYRQGRTLKIPSERAELQQLIAECEQQLSSADNILRLAVSKGLIKNIKKQAVAIEIQYRKPRVILIPNLNNRSVTFQNILIPITGDLAGSITTIFLGNPQYISGPYRNSKGTEFLFKIVEGLDLK